MSWSIVDDNHHDGTKLQIEGDRLFIFQKDGKRMPAKDGKYMTKGGTEIIVQRGRIIKITGRGGKSVSPGTREGADPFGGTSGTPTSIPPKDPWIPGTQQKVLKGGQK